MSDPIRIATRESPLALWQAETVRDRLRTGGADEQAPEVELVPMTTRADQWLSTPLSRIGGKGLFVKELEMALLDGRADLAVHSMKDVTAEMPPGLSINCVLEREDPFDAFVSNHHGTIADLPEGAVVGTCSPRRVAQLRTIRPDLTIRSLRGNVNTRLARLDAGDYDAIILACAGLRRLGFEARIRQTLSSDHSLPAIGQGIIGIQSRIDDDRLNARLADLHDIDSADRLTSERALAAGLAGGCSSPIAGYSTLEQNRLHLTARVIGLDGQRCLQVSGDADRDQAEALGLSLADDLLAQGARQLLDEADAIAAADAG